MLFFLLTGNRRSRTVRRPKNQEFARSAGRRRWGAPRAHINPLIDMVNFISSGYRAAEAGYVVR